jgi:hypothetical protein
LGLGLFVAFAAATAVVAIVALLLSAIVVASMMGLAVVGAAHVARRFGGRPPRRQRGHRALPAVESAPELPIDTLRRRYAAGEIGQTEFRRGLVELLKARYVRGDLTMAEFESRVRHVLLDPALQPPS